jgi:hypothetical protein
MRRNQSTFRARACAASGKVWRELFANQSRAAQPLRGAGLSGA